MTIKGLSRLQTNEMPRILVVVLLFALPFAVILSTSWAVAIPAFLISALIAFWWWRKDMAALKKRAESLEREPRDWLVQVNGIDVGRISDARLARLQLAAAKDARCYLAQALTLIKAVVVTAGIVVLMAPAAAFWIIAILGMTSPEALAEAVRLLPSAAAADISDVTRLLIQMALLLAVLALPLLISFKPKAFGFFDRFDRQVEGAVRQELGVAAKGSLDFLPSLGDDNA